MPSREAALFFLISRLQPVELFGLPPLLLMILCRQILQLIPQISAGHLLLGSRENSKKIVRFDMYVCDLSISPYLLR
jgi:hypothetical protein